MVQSWWRHQMKTFSRYWPLVRGIHRSPVNSPHKGEWPGALMFSLICTRINSWVNNGEASDLRCHRAHHDATVMILPIHSHPVTYIDMFSFYCHPYYKLQNMIVNCIDGTRRRLLRNGENKYTLDFILTFDYELSRTATEQCDNFY